MRQQREAGENEAEREVWQLGEMRFQLQQIHLTVPSMLRTNLMEHRQYALHKLASERLTRVRESADKSQQIPIRKNQNMKKSKGT